jgi:hypothetical protein
MKPERLVLKATPAFVPMELAMTITTVAINMSPRCDLSNILTWALRLAQMHVALLIIWRKEEP